jgi:hypothetical protein
VSQTNARRIQSATPETATCPMLRDRVVLSWRAASGRVPFFGVLADVGHAGFGDAQQVERRDQQGAPVLAGGATDPLATEEPEVDDLW